jgi:hypothetical protein
VKFRLVTSLPPCFTLSAITKQSTTLVIAIMNSSWCGGNSLRTIRPVRMTAEVGDTFPFPGVKINLDASSERRLRPPISVFSSESPK